MPRSLVIAPTLEPVTVLDAKAQLRVTDSAEDAIIERYIRVAREWTERHLQRALITQTWDQWEDEFPSRHPYEIRLDLPPLQSVESVQYLDGDGALQTLATSVYDVDASMVPGRIRLAYDQSWPTIRCVANAVVIRFVAGFQSADSPPVDEVPEQIRQAILLHVEHLYDERGGAKSLPPSIEALLSPYRAVEL